METEIANRAKISEENHNGIINGFPKVANGNTANVLREMSADELLKRAQQIRDEVLEQVDERINDMISEILQKVKAYSKNEGELVSDPDKYRDKRQSNKDGVLPDKEFLERDSLLNDLFKISHMHTVYNIFVVILMLLFLNTAIYDIIDTGTLYVGTTTIQIAFDKFSICSYIWLLMQISTFGVYLAFNLWAHQRLEFLPKSLILKIWDYTWLIIFILYQIIFVIFPTKALLEEDLSIACSIIVLMEQIRFMMKSYAFVRSTAPMFLSYKPHSEIEKPSGPGFSQYLYFLFVPTLVYRDSYPRTKKIRWMVVVKSFGEVVLVIFYYAFILERLVLPVFSVTGKQSFQWKWFVKSSLAMVFPGILILVCGFYCLLHAWMNAWAELLRFADRLFYKDWWNATSYRTYYRTWNIVVHDWLYTYVYKDMYEIIVPRNKLLSTAAVFLMSSVFHEYILALAFRFFYPVLLILFGGLGFPLIFARKGASNIFMWFSLFVGMGLIVSMYTMESYARINCPPYPDKLIDFFLPRSWVC